MRRAAAFFPIVLAIGAINLAPTARAQDGREGPREIEKCQTINKPGSYKLVRNLTPPTSAVDCLVITANDVTIDLAGFEISIIGPGQGIGNGVSEGGTSLQGITVRNGSISSFSSGVALGKSDHSIVEGLRVSGNGAGTGDGIDANGIVRGNTVTFVGRTGIMASGVVTGNYVTSSGGSGMNPPIGEGISVGVGSTVIGNTVVNNPDVGLKAICPSNLTANTAVNNPGGDIVPVGNGCNITNNVPVPP